MPRYQRGVNGQGETGRGSKGGNPGTGGISPDLVDIVLADIVLVDIVNVRSKEYRPPPWRFGDLAQFPGRKFRPRNVLRCQARPPLLPRSFAVSFPQFGGLGR